MPGIKLQKRADDFFVSYGHGDFARVSTIVNLLKRTCGLHIWFDGFEGNAAVRSSELLAGAIGNSRGVLIFLSEAWKRSTWCKNEYEIALSEQRMHAGFEIVCVRLDDIEQPGWFNNSEILDMRESNLPVFAHLLKSLSSDVPHRFDNAEDTYLAAPWSRPSPLVRETYEALRLTGWRLVGDTPTLKHLGERRIEAIQRTVRGVVAILPHDPMQPEFSTSPYILREALIAKEIGKPLLLLNEPGVELPDDLIRSAFRMKSFTLAPGPEEREKLQIILDDFDSYLANVPHSDTGAFIFFASSLRGELSEESEIDKVIERASNVRCIRGERVSGDNVQQSIIDLIRRAAVVIADVSEDNRNTLIEAGIAMGSGTQLKLLCREPQQGHPLKKRFMFEGQELHWYSTPEQRVGLCYYFSRQYRRQIYVIR